MVGKTGVVGVMAEKLLSITAAAAAAALPAGLNYEKHTTVLSSTCTKSFSRAAWGIMWPLTPTPETRGMAAQDTHHEQV